MNVMRKFWKPTVSRRPDGTGIIVGLVVSPILWLLIAWVASVLWPLAVGVWN